MVRLMTWPSRSERTSPSSKVKRSHWRWASSCSNGAEVGDGSWSCMLPSSCPWGGGVERRGVVQRPVLAGLRGLDGGEHLPADAQPGEGAEVTVVDLVAPEIAGGFQ